MSSEGGYLLNASTHQVQLIKI